MNGQLSPPTCQNGRSHGKEFFFISKSFLPCDRSHARVLIWATPCLLQVSCLSLCPSVWLCKPNSSSLDCLIVMTCTVYCTTALEEALVSSIFFFFFLLKRDFRHCLLRFHLGLFGAPALALVCLLFIFSDGLLRKQIPRLLSLFFPPFIF